MTKPKAGGVDRTLECMVCGKLFPRGPNDLLRHSIATTLLHLVSESEDETHPHGCNKCGLFFTTEIHLQMHSELSSCNKSKNQKQSGIFQKIQVPKEIEHIETSSMSSELELKTLECMVCGKLFPRGPIDLARHSQANTLRHMVSTSFSSTYSHGCERCDRYFTTEEHLISHHENTTCNPAMIWPENAHTTAGLRAINKNKAAQIVKSTPSHSKKSKSKNFKSEYDVTAEETYTDDLYDNAGMHIKEEGYPHHELQDVDNEHSHLIDGTTDGVAAETNNVSNSGRVRKQTSMEMYISSVPRINYPVSNTNQHQLHGNALHKVTTKPTNSTGVSPRVSMHNATGSSPRVPHSMDNSTSTSKSHKKKEYPGVKSPVTGDSQQQPRVKRQKMIIPEERKAYYAIVSLLITQHPNPEMVKITEDNYEEFIPEKHRELVERMKKLLHYNV